MDYHSGPYTVKFPTGVATTTFNISINNDNVLEDNENFTLTINSSSLPGNVTVGNPGEATVTIVDDGRHVCYYSRSSSGNCTIIW